MHSSWNFQWNLEQKDVSIAREDEKLALRMYSLVWAELSSMWPKSGGSDDADVRGSSTPAKISIFLDVSSISIICSKLSWIFVSWHVDQPYFLLLPIVLSSRRPPQTQSLGVMLVGRLSYVYVGARKCAVRLRVNSISQSGLFVRFRDCNTELLCGYLRERSLSLRER